MTPPRVIDLKIVRGENPPPLNQPIIVIGGSGKIVRDGNILRLRHDAKTTLPEAALQLLQLLDEKYFTAGKFPKSGEGEDEAEMIKKSGLAGKLLNGVEN